MSALRDLAKAFVPPALRAGLQSLQLSHTHLVVRAADGSGGFSLFGEDGRREHYERLYLGGAPAVSRHGVHGTHYSRLALRLAHRDGLVVVTRAPLPAALEPVALRVPRALAMCTDIGDSEAAFVKALPHSARDDIRRVRSEGFACEIIQDANWADEFTRRFHERSMALRHGGEGFVLAEKYAAQAVRDQGAEFLCVTHGGRRLGAMLAGRHQQRYRMHHLGWLDGDPALVKRGVLAALYWFATRRARELGLRVVHMGHVQPYLGNGVLKFKMKWNAWLEMPDRGIPVHRMILDTAHPCAARFLAGQSIIALDPENRFIVYSGLKPEEVRLSDRVRGCLARWYRPAEMPEGTSRNGTRQIGAGQWVEVPMPR